jgi:ABC-type hemin transport system ATPase subunit
VTLASSATVSLTACNSSNEGQTLVVDISFLIKSTDVSVPYGANGTGLARNMAGHSGNNRKSHAATQEMKII